MNKSAVLALLANPRNVERALLGLFLRQTEAERATSTTSERNDRGFSMKTDRWGTILGRCVKNGQHLTTRQLAVARDICSYHWRQTAEILAPRPLPVEYRGSDMSYLLRQHDRFQVFPGLTQHA